jgi:CRISPR-associated endonuclease/helicase Cas3
MERSAKKAERLIQMEQMLLAHPEGLRRAGIARRLGVHRSTVGRDIDELSLRVPIWEDGNLLGINRDDYRVDVRVTLHEAMALHLAARLMATRTDKHNPHAGAALRKLGLALERLAPLVSRHLLASADVMDDEAQRHDPLYLDVLETLTRAWSQERMVRLWHKHEPSGRVYEYTFAPYFIEPYAVGQTTHVIGWREPPGALRTFKLERVQRVELTDESYTIPDDFDPRAKLGHLVHRGRAGGGGSALSPARGGPRARDALAPQRGRGGAARREPAVAGAGGRAAGDAALDSRVGGGCGGVGAGGVARPTDG